MSRLSTEPVTVRPQNNIYTALAAAAVAVAILGLLALYLRGKEVFGTFP